MSFIQKLLNLGLKFEQTSIDEEHFKSFVLSRDVMASIQYLYFLQYRKVASTITSHIHEDKMDDFIKFLGQDGYTVNHINGRIARHSSCSYFIGNSTRNILIDVEFTESDDSDEDDKLVDVSFAFNGTSGVHHVYEIIEKFCQTEKNNDRGKILFFEKDSYGEMVLTPHKVDHYDLDISENYNDDFLPVHNNILNWLGDFSQNNNKLVLFHGVPGSGKTNYIKYLLSQSPEVNKIYLAPFFVTSMADPAFLPIIRREKKSILIIEDAEKILTKREHTSDNSMISILLNLCDGIMASVLDFKIIATFNVDEDLIDDALKRKGRMFLKYKFDALSEQKTRQLYHKVHNREPEKKNMTLAEIYNTENDFSKKPEPQRMGFGV